MMQAKKAEFTAKGKSIDDKDVTLILKAIKGVSHRFDSTQIRTKQLTKEKESGVRFTRYQTTVPLIFNVL